MNPIKYPSSNTYNPTDFVYNYGSHPIIISPNLGIPTFLSLLNDQGKPMQSAEFSLNIIAPFEFTGEKVRELLVNNVFLCPLFAHDPQSKKLLRGEPIPLEFVSIAQTRELTLDSILLSELYQNRNDRRSYLLRHNFFGEDRTIFCAKGRFIFRERSDIILWFETHELLMFDLVQTFPSLAESQSRINYHSIVIKKSNWESLKFAHITDIHIAKRYDEFLGVMASQFKKRQTLRLDLLVRQRLQTPQLEDDTSADELNEYHPGPLIHRFKNPNNILRRFIQWANRSILHNDLDFVIITGDIIDYCLKENVGTSENLELPETNWDVFLRILLNQPLEIRSDILPMHILTNEEIAVPIFTLTGNHDVRLNGYPLTAIGMNKNFNLTTREARLYYDPIELTNVKSLIIDKYCLKAYYQFFNPFDDYFLRFGNSTFLLLNTGRDSFLNVKSLLMGSPASVGFKVSQLRFATAVAERFIKEYDSTDVYHNFLLSHAPVLNPAVRNLFIRKFKSIFGLDQVPHPEYFKESHLKKHAIPETHADSKLDFKFGTIHENWVETITLMLRYSMIGLHGHTHQSREFKIAFCADDKACFLPNGKMTSHPFRVYWDDYSRLIAAEQIQTEKPFDFQTPSLTIREKSEPKKVGPFRVIHITHHKLVQIQIRFLADLLKTS